MASSLLQRLLRRRPLITTALLPNPYLANHHQFQTLAASSPLLHSRSIDSRLASLLSPPKQVKEDGEVGAGAKYEFVYPSFSYGVVLNPIFRVEVEEGAEKGMWMDSTKKKRKKKMNKHKYRKMRRKLRHRG